MSLTVKSGVITIQNAQGQTKFTSTDRLVYQKKYMSGEITMDATVETVGVPFSPAGPNDFLVVAVNFSYIYTVQSYADVATSTTNKWLPANGTLMISVNPREVNQQAYCSTQTFGVALLNDTLYFKRTQYSSNGDLNYGNSDTFDEQRVPLSFQYIARLLSYL
jgi:hypothetical protein